MKKLLYIICLSATVSLAFMWHNKPTIEFEKDTFSRGESFTFNLHYGIIHAGDAEVKIDENLHLINEKNCYLMSVHGYSIGFWRTIFKIEDQWISYIDTSVFRPCRSHRYIEEGRYKIKENVNYDYVDNLAKVWRKHPDKEKEELEFKIPSNVHDVVSGFFELRRVNYNKLKIGDTIALKAFLDKENFNFKVRYMGKGKVKTKAGKFKAIKLVPIMPNNKVFTGEEAIKFWISDDKNKMPVMAEAELFVGTVVLELTSYKGLKHEINVIK